jgi:hypothetical protein
MEGSLAAQEGRQGRVCEQPKQQRCRCRSIQGEKEFDDAMTERAGIKKPEGRACASPPLTFSAAATAAGTKILLARRDAGSGFGTRPT